MKDSKIVELLQVPSAFSVDANLVRAHPTSAKILIGLLSII